MFADITNPFCNYKNIYSVFSDVNKEPANINESFV